MKLGIKAGFRNDWARDISETHPDFCEIWFEATQMDKYKDLVAGIKKLGVGVGLHYWGALADGTLSNIAYPNNKTLNESKALIKKTIDYAAHFEALYVNIHPSGQILTKVDFAKEEYQPYTAKGDPQVTLTNLRESINELAAYATQRGVILTVESAPKYALGNPWHGPSGRVKPIYVGEFILDEIETIYIDPNVYFAHDFGHTGAQIISAYRNEVKNKIFDIARRLLNKTKLLHVSYLIPPYNGSDYHGCLYFDETLTDLAVPNRNELVELLRIYKDSDVFALVEPEKDHPGNFKTLQKLVKESQI